jgi:hypothetical protein
MNYGPKTIRNESTLYFRVLTAIEVSQNYNVIKNRVGV